MAHCKACGREYRKGILCQLLTPQGLTGARVCQKCASLGVLIVPMQLGPVVQQVSQRSEGVERAIRMLRTYVGAARDAATRTNDPVLQGRAEGLETALETLQQEERIGVQ